MTSDSRETKRNLDVDTSHHLERRRRRVGRRSIKGNSTSDLQEDDFTSIDGTTLGERPAYHDVTWDDELDDDSEEGVAWDDSDIDFEAEEFVLDEDEPKNNWQEEKEEERLTRKKGKNASHITERKHISDKRHYKKEKRIKHLLPYSIAIVSISFLLTSYLLSGTLPRFFNESSILTMALAFGFIHIIRSFLGQRVR